METAGIRVVWRRWGCWEVVNGVGMVEFVDDEEKLGTRMNVAKVYTLMEMSMPTLTWPHCMSVVQTFSLGFLK